MSFLASVMRLLPLWSVYAHCDIPCGIYDPHTAQLGAQTVLKMVQKIKELDPKDQNNFVRMVMIKEEHAELCKKEILILWTDYFKAEHLEKFPSLHDLIWKTTKLCSDNKRTIDEAKAIALIKAVDEIAQIFAQTKKQ